MAATATYFQGGDFVELLSAQGKAPAATWKLQGKITKSFEKLIKGNAFLLDGSADTKMQLPKATQSAALGLTQRFLVVQLLVPFTKSFSVEIGFTDFQKVRRRFVVASAFRETTVTALHAQIPLAAAEIDRDQWINLVFDLQTLTDKYFPGTVFRSMESLCISGSCRLKRVFTMKDPPTPSLSSTGEVVAPSVHTVDIPRQFVFSSSAGVGPVPTQYFASMGQQPASDLSSGAVVVGQAKAAEKRTVDSGKPVKVGKGRAAGPTERKPVETENTKAVSARRAGKVPAPVARGVRVASMANKQDEETTTPRTVLANVRSDVEEPLDHSQSPKRPNIVDNNDDFYPTKRPASSLSSRPSTSTRVSKVDLHEGLNDPSALRPSSGSRSRPSALTRASRDGSPDRLDNSLAQRPSSGLHSRPATAAGTPLLSSIMVEEAVLNRSPSPNKSKMMNSKQKSPQGHSRPLRSSSARSSRQSIGMAAPLPSSIMIDELEARAGQMPPDRVRSSPSPTARARSPAKMQRREIFSQIQQRLSLMSADNDRESARNQELFLQHSTLHRSSEDDLAFDDNSSRYHATTVDRGERPDLPDNSSLAREHAPVAKRIGGGGGYTRAVSAESSRPSIFSFESDARRGQSSRTSDDDDYLMAMKRKRLFDFDSLLDSIDGQSSMLDATSNTAADNRPSLANSDQDDEQQMNDAPLMPGATEYRSSDVDDNASGHMEIDEHDDVEEESTSDRELEQLLAAKRAARQHQQPIVPRPQQDEGGHAEDGPSLDDLDDLDASDSDANKTTEPRSIWHFDEAVATSNEVGAQEERLGPNDSDLCPPDQEDADEDDNLELSMDLCVKGMSSVSFQWLALIPMSVDILQDGRVGR